MIGLFYGTRPEYIKLKPLFVELTKENVQYKLFQVGQHASLLDGCKFDYRVEVRNTTSNRLNDIIISILNYKLPEELDYIMVQGDTTTAMAIAMNAFNCEIPVMHLEAGLRTYNKKSPFPEEVNRRLISVLAEIHYCPTKQDMAHLLLEGNKDHIFETGNTVIDNIRDMVSSKSNEVIVTLHRRENQKDLKDWYKVIENLASSYPNYSFVFPMHPSPEVQKHKEIFKEVRVCDPFPYDEMKRRISSCAFAITDSGGIQEECSFFNKLCLVCRTVTERPSGTSVLCRNPTELFDNFKNNCMREFNIDCPFGDGYASRKITKDILGRV